MARLPAPTADELRAAFAAGDNVAEIAARFRCSQRNVRHLAGRYGVDLPRARRRSTASGRLGDAHWLRSAFNDGLSKSTIATALGVRPAEVDAALRAAGWPTGPPSRRARVLDDEQRLRARFAAGGTAATIAAEVGCARATVSAAARRFGITRTDPRVKFVRLQDPVWLTEQLSMRTVREIAAELGCSQSAVAQAKRRAGLQPKRATFPLLDDYDWLHTQYVVHRRSLADVSTQVGCSTATLERALTRHGLWRTSRGPQPRVTDRRWLLVQRSLGRSAPDLAAEVGLSATAMRATLHRFGLQPGRHTIERRARLDWERTGSINIVARLNRLSHANARALLIELGLLDCHDSARTLPRRS